MPHPYIDEASPASLAGFVGMLRWAGRYGHELSAPTPSAQGYFIDAEAVELEVSSALSASFNPGFGPEDSVYLMVYAEEYEWLSLLHIEEVIVSNRGVCVLCRGLQDGDFMIAMIAIWLQTDQPKLWDAMRRNELIRFGCLRHNDEGYEAIEFMFDGVALRFLNS